MLHAPSNLVHRVEEVAARACPAVTVRQLDGWLLRFSGGKIRRPNSVLANDSEDRLPLAEKIAAVEQFYAERDATVRYQLCPASRPAELDAALTERGYRRTDTVHVQMAPVAAVIERANLAPGLDVCVTDRLEEWWLAACRDVEKASERDAAARRRILERIEPAAGYAAAYEAGEPTAVGRTVGDGDWAGVFGIATRAESRRRGGATAVLAALAGWARDRGIGQMYLQVGAQNAGALALYARLGFHTLYEYHYRERG